MLVNSPLNEELASYTSILTILYIIRRHTILDQDIM
jgi:hypothetical protein